MRNLALYATAILGLTAPSVQAQDSTAKSMLAPVPTTKILAIGSLVEQSVPDRMKQIMPSEVRDTVKLYLAGKIDQWFVRQDKNGVVFIMNAESVDEARALLEKLPLGEQGLMTFDLIPLGPLSPLRFLMPAPANP